MVASSTAAPQASRAWPQPAREGSRYPCKDICVAIQLHPGASAFVFFFYCVLQQVQFFKCIEFPHGQSEPSTLSQLKICLPSGCGRAKFQLARCQGLCRALLIADACQRGARRSTAVPQYPLASNLFGDSYPLKVRFGCLLLPGSMKAD